MTEPKYIFPPILLRTQLIQCAYFQIERFAHGRGASTESVGSSASTSVQWHGTCIHRVDPPRWVQKRRHVDPGDVVGYAYAEPRRAMAVALNPKFSMLAIGTYK